MKLHFLFQSEGCCDYFSAYEEEGGDLIAESESYANPGFDGVLKSAADTMYIEWNTDSSGHTYNGWVVSIQMTNGTVKGNF